MGSCGTQLSFIGLGRDTALSVTPVGITLFAFCLSRATKVMAANSQDGSLTQ